MLQVIVFRRLREIKYLDEEDLLIAWLDCFFCECFRSLCVTVVLILWQVTGLCGIGTSSTGISAQVT